MIQLEPKKQDSPNTDTNTSTKSGSKRETDGSIIKSSNYGKADPDPKDES